MNILAFFKNQKGAAVVELALVAPVIAGIALVSYGVWDGAARRQDMRDGLGAAVQYYMNGGLDDTAAQSAAMDAWDSAPADAAVSTERICRCGSAAAVCNSLCADSRTPSVFVRLTATATTADALFSPSLSEERVVRVR